MIAILRFSRPTSAGSFTLLNGKSLRRMLDGRDMGTEKAETKLVRRLLAMRQPERASLDDSRWKVPGLVANSWITYHVRSSTNCHDAITGVKTLRKVPRGTPMLLTMCRKGLEDIRRVLTLARSRARRNWPSGFVHRPQDHRCHGRVAVGTPLYVRREVLAEDRGDGRSLFRPSGLIWGDQCARARRDDHLIL